MALELYVLGTEGMDILEGEVEGVLISVHFRYCIVSFYHNYWNILLALNQEYTSKE